MHSTKHQFVASSALSTVANAEFCPDCILINPAIGMRSTKPRFVASSALSAVANDEWGAVARIHELKMEN
jgi:hypothetical protein